MNCPTCQTPNDPDARFCKSCGAALTPGQAKPTRWPLLLGILIGGGLLVVAIIALALFWLMRPQEQSDVVTIEPAKGGTVKLANDRVELTLPPEGLSGPVRLNASAISADQLRVGDIADETGLAAALAQLPPHLSLQSAVYHFEVEGPPPSVALLNLLSPTTADARTLDLYAWDGTSWRWLPSRLDVGSGRLAAQLELLPPAVALLRREPGTPIITADLAPETTLPPTAEGTLTELLLTGFSVDVDGSIQTASALLEVESTAVLIPSLRNWRNDGTLTASLNDILADPTRRQRHVEAIVGLALAGGYPAVQLDYRLGAVPGEAFSAFITDLAAALHEQNRSLLIRVEAPVQVAATRWDTGAYDWAAISQAADRLQVPLPTDPTALAQGQAAALLTWVVGQVERSKLQAIVSWRNFEVSEGGAIALPIGEVLAELGPIELTSESEGIQPDDRVTLSLAGLTSAVVEVDPASGMLHLAGPDQGGETHQFYLQTNASQSQWLQRIAGYNLAGIVLEGLFDEAPAGQTWELLQAYRALNVPSVESEPTWVWTITATDTSTKPLKVETRPLAEANYTWTAPDTPGEYQIEVALSTGEGASAQPVARLALLVAPAATPTPSPTLTPTPAPPQPPTPTPTLTPTPTPAPPLPPPPPSRPFQLVYTKWDGRFHNLYIADSSTRREQLVFTRAAGPSFSPDKKRLFFIGEQGVDQQIRENRVACSFGTISEGIVAIDLPSPLTDICQVQSDAWTCDRKQIDIGLGPSDVCTANNIFVYQNLDWKVGSARWTRTSPTGDSVAFDAKPGIPDYRTYFRAVDPLSQQFHFEIPGEQASWSPDGEKLVYRSGRNNQAGLWISNRDDSNPIRITDNGTDSFPAWSPDGQTIVFSREVEGDVELGAINPDGSNLRRLTNARGHDTLPVFTPTGQIIFRSDRNGSWGIWQMNSDGSGQTEIISNAPVSHIDWAFDRMDVK
jgi:hypothetical protein